ncbi:MAG TPA: MFS transporter, partial [Burkholderiaceae bacterium]|nr:MFS transporter [Burkholderiaceae bacterium]
LGEGAIFPVIALSAKALGASSAIAGLIVALIGLGSLLNNIPAALITARYGERRAMIAASVFSVFALLFCLLAQTVWVLGLGVFMIGMATSVFLLARQTFLIEAVPIALRARAMSTLGGTMRIGLFIGPFVGAGFMHFMGLSGAYIAAIVALIGTGILSFAIPDLPSTSATQSTTRKKPALSQLAKTHSRTYLTLGSACALVAAIRACRQIVIPLWAVHIGLDAATTAVVYGLMGAVDMLLFYPAGKIMDRHGRHYIALASMGLMGSALISLIFTHSLIPFVIFSLLLGFGNGIGSGLIMTVGADASPAQGRNQFLGMWRFITDLGTGGGPLLLSGLTAVAGLASGLVGIGGLGFVAAAMFWRWLPRRPLH